MKYEEKQGRGEDLEAAELHSFGFLLHVGGFDLTITELSHVKFHSF